MRAKLSRRVVAAMVLLIDMVEKEDISVRLCTKDKSNLIVLLPRCQDKHHSFPLVFLFPTCSSFLYVSRLARSMRKVLWTLMSFSTKSWARGAHWPSRLCVQYLRKECLKNVWYLPAHYPRFRRHKCMSYLRIVLHMTTRTLRYEIDSLIHTTIFERYYQYRRWILRMWAKWIARALRCQ